ncbi:Uncharacterised protein [Legionella wadsworthii]|uniref:Glycosyltransferase RgtA/B/C/D-like domain-containing protein n=1 Tax=Legionella wadsworthii TaxID=28088 RepID=A0A378LUL0_9GAMM|nr:hypothetical protein [Legionella wadsworthii]STY29509.1 Uncharacterised protein [Legionella wadsworthii]
MPLIKNKYLYLGFLIAGLVSYFVFYYTFQFQVWSDSKQHLVSDIPGHTQFIIDFSKYGNFPVYSLWYRLVYFISGYSSEYRHLSFVTMYLLSILVCLKYLINYWLLKKESANVQLVSLLSMALIFVMPILSYYTKANHPEQILVDNFHVYLGNISANQWHNSTLIFAMPANILFFYYSIKNLDSNRWFPFFMMGGLAVLSIFCKPNYAMAFLPVLTIGLFLLNLKSRSYLNAFIKPALIIIPALMTLSYQWYFTFVKNELFNHPTATVFAPFLVWSTYSPHLFISLLLSIAFPLIILVFYFKKMDRFLIIAWLTFLVSLGIFSFFAEYPVHLNGNFWWGSIASNYILFLFSVKLLLTQSINWKSITAYSILGLHFVSGCFLLVSFFYRETSLIL